MIMTEQEVQKLENQLQVLVEVRKEYKHMPIEHIIDAISSRLTTHDINKRYGMKLDEGKGGDEL